MFEKETAQMPPRDAMPLGKRFDILAIECAFIDET
jgi:hypothetical protein